jgi:hypothetical protein
MTAEQFGTLVADLWRARQHMEAARQRIEKDGIVIKRRSGLPPAQIANPAVEEYAAASKEVKRIAALLAA